MSDNTSINVETIKSLDLSSIREKYNYERDRRIREDKNEQYIEITGDFSYYADDPYKTDRIERAALTDTKEIIIIGGGFGGLLVGAQLRSGGYEDIRIIEKGSDFGGTWYWNRYPGVQCDVESYIYLPLLEETGYIPSLKYTFGDEIYEHTKRIASHYELNRDVCFQTEVTSVAWIEKDKQWEVKTDRGDRMRAKYLCVCNGPLDKPRLPGIPGINDFKGHSFHTSRWDYEYTGGDLYGGLTKLADKRVAIIGTGSTALQCVPHLGEYAKQLYVVQRTPTSVDVRNNEKTDIDWFKSLKPGWHAEMCDNFDNLIFGFPPAEDLIKDGWTDMVNIAEEIIAAMMMSGDFTPEDIDGLIEKADYISMQRIRDRVDAIVEDPATAAKLKCWYRKWCKRPGFHDEYLQTFNRANVSLLDTEGKGLSRIGEHSIFVGDKEYEIDCLIFATGFEIGTSFTRRAGYDILGRDGIAMSEKWANGPKSQYGIQIRSFPNMFITGVNHAAAGVNITNLLNEQAKHIAHAIICTEAVNGATVEVSEEGEQGWSDAIANSGGEKRREFLGSCTPGYYNGEGDPEAKGGLWEFEYSAGAADFYGLLRDWRHLSCLPGLEVDGTPLPPTAGDKEYLKSEPAIRTRLHRELKLLRHRMDMANIPPIGSVPATQFREIFATGASMMGKGPELHEVQDVTINDNCSARIYRGSEQPNNIVLFFHGGGWVLGSVATHDNLVRRLAKASGATFVSVEYRLAPEAPFPAAVDDAIASIQWVNANRSELANAPAKLFVCGDSAGGNLAAVVALKCRDELDIELAGQILLYPAVDGDLNNPELDKFDSPLLKKNEIVWFYDQYTPNAEDRLDERVSPIVANSHKSLPPAFILTAEFDLLSAEASRYGELLAQAGVKTYCKEFSGAMHGFLTDAIGSSLTKQAIADVCAFINEINQS